MAVDQAETGKSISALARLRQAVTIGGEGGEEASRTGAGKIVRKGVVWSVNTLGAVYVIGLLWVVFSAAAPKSFPTASTVTITLNGAATVGLVALAVVVPLAAGIYDFSVGATAGLSGVVVAWVLANTGVPVAVAVLVAVFAGVVVGLVNAFIVVVLRIDSFIGTLAVSAIVTAFVLMLSGGIPIVGRVSGAFSSIISGLGVGGVVLPAWVMLGVALALIYLMHVTPLGRYVYASGFNRSAAELAGLRVSLIQVLALVISGTVAGLAGIMEAGVLGSGSPTVGSSYLLPAYAAAFLGSTQVAPGRFNPLGAVIGTVLLELGTVGLGAVGAPSWAASMYEGLVLIAAVAVGVRRHFRKRRPRQRLKT